MAIYIGPVNPFLGPSPGSTKHATIQRECLNALLFGHRAEVR